MKRRWLSILGVGLGLTPARPSAAATDLTGVVFVDKNANGTREAGEPGLAGVAVSDQNDVVTTSADGSFRISGSAVRFRR